MEKYAKRRASILEELDGLRVEVDAEKKIGWLILDRPPLNIVSYMARSQVSAIFEEFGRDDDVRVIVVRGADGVYTSGGDVKGFFDVPRDGMSHLAWNIGAPTRCGKPVICAMEKYAFGVGFELSLACDFRLATKETLVGLPEVTIGEIPGSGGTHRLANLIGLTRANHMIYLGERIPAPKALDWGILTDVAEDSDALTEMIGKYTKRLAASSPLALRTVKRVLNTAYDTSLEVGLELEGHAYEKLRDSHDYKEGADAFFNKRKPEYTGD
jgi:2-oxoglutaroyl-CoA hydrolase